MSCRFTNTDRTHYRVLVFLACLGCSSCVDSNQSSPAPLPELSRIKRIRISWDQVPDAERPATTQFDIVDHFDEIIDALKPNRVELAPLKYVGAGHLVIDQDNDYPMGINVFWSSDETCVFQIGGTYYRGGPKNKLSDAIRKRRPR
jgi:hypothetical protein